MTVKFVEIEFRVMHTEDSPLSTEFETLMWNGEEKPNFITIPILRLKWRILNKDLKHGHFFNLIKSAEKANFTVLFTIFLKNRKLGENWFESENMCLTSMSWSLQFKLFPYRELDHSLIFLLIWLDSKMEDISSANLILFTHCLDIYMFSIKLAMELKLKKSPYPFLIPTESPTSPRPLIKITKFSSIAQESSLWHFHHRVKAATVTSHQVMIMTKVVSNLLRKVLEKLTHKLMTG